ncbi:hypothetical protein MASR2M48_29380 [Spirochaetota bacterium]
MALCTVFACISHDKAALLYEFTEGDGAPPTIHRGSLRIGQEGLRFDGRDGETIRYRLRVVAVNASSMGDVGDEGYRERFYSFTIDRYTRCAEGDDPVLLAIRHPMPFIKPTLHACLCVCF